ncbi:MAG: uroporphyrinogen decarboxylase [Anaerolineaceae bacterium]|nr:uroporphyrinogen decarboxylase [Chloroflexota bacterium]WKZ53307.1 MAG: uroporphyrinogen decarboxylase family protein [Anaerolineales bacterium]GJQ38398.1 MAG: uroporphyrinogen decarboxylase [Anaerolineaceae bacterium]NOG75390.1 uroporphyrinogen decarboxylase [Chloroflexota bacterium]GIK08452.1 MAG: uroporphyrinogen decarboxylase [Chloroflexota bacterium]
MTTHRERLQTCLDGGQPDRVPVALWRHFPVDDQSPETLAAATLHWQRQYDFDFVKVTPASSFCLKDWGADDVWEGHTEGTRRYVKRVVSGPRDWARLPELDPTSEPHLAAQLKCLRLIKQRLPAETPLIQTVFSPLAQAKNLAGSDALLAHLRLYPDDVMKGLETIARTTRRFVEAALETGIDGIFYAVQHAQAALLSLEEYQTFGLPFDQQVIEPAKSSWLNVLHLHGRDIHYSLLSALSFPIVNWHDRETAPSLAEAQALHDGVVCGGLRQDTLALGNPAQVREEAEEAIRQTRGRKFILSTGCVVPVIASHGNLVAARESVEK